MQPVIVAFEGIANGGKIKELLESGGEFSCLVCRSAAEVKRAVHKQPRSIIVCGFKLADETCEGLFYDLPTGCFMLMVAPRARLELSGTEGIFKLQSPVRRGELLASVRMLAQFQRYIPREKGPAKRDGEAQKLIARAKAVLMDRHGMTEEQAHRFLQKQSMDNGAKLTDTARLVLADQ